MGTLEIRLLGGFRVEAGGQAIADDAWRLRKAAAIVKLLALTPGHRLHREQLIDRLWPDLDPDAAAGQFRKALHEARRALDPDPDRTEHYLQRTGEMVQLCHDARVDVDAFEHAAAEARRLGRPDAYDAALRLYTGHLLPEDRYDEGLADRADELRREHLALLLEAVGLLEARGDFDAAGAAARSALVDDPLCEAAHAALMRIYVLAGRRAEALAQYERLRAALRTDLGAEPDPTTQRLYEQIRAGRQLEPVLAAQVWEQVGDLRVLGGDAAGAAASYESSLEAAVGTAPSMRRARLHRKAAQAHLMDSSPARAEPHLRSAIRLVGVGGDRRERGRLLDAEATWLWQTGRLDRAEVAAERGRRCAEEHGTPEDVAAAYETLAIVHHCRGSWQQGLHVEIQRLGSGADRMPELARVFDIHHCIGQYHLYGDALAADVEDYARRTLDLARRVGATRAEAFAWCLLGEALLLGGRWDEADACLQQSTAIHDQLGVNACGLVWQRLGELDVERGDSVSAAAHVRRGMAIATVSPMARHVWGRLYATLAFDAVERGEPVEAVRAVRSASAAAARYGDCPSCSALLNPVAAEAYAALAQPERAWAHVAAAERVARSFDSSAWRAMAESARGSLAAAERDGARARQHFLAAADLYDRARQPFWTARARMQAAVAGDIVDHALLDAAAADFERLGARRAAATVRRIAWQGNAQGTAATHHATHERDQGGAHAGAG